MSCGMEGSTRRRSNPQSAFSQATRLRRACGTCSSRIFPSLPMLMTSFWTASLSATLNRPTMLLSSRPLSRVSNAVIIKTKWMLFGPLPHILPLIYVGPSLIELVDEYKFVGIWFTSTTRQIFSKHYSVKASKARSVSYATFSVESFVGVLPPREGLLLYKARVDPHLTFGCEVVLDVDHVLGPTLDAPQNHFLRRLLGLNRRSMLAVLFTETGMMPIRYRRALLALRYAQGFAAIPADVEDIPRASFRESLRIAGQGHSCWASDLHWVLSSLPVPVALDYAALLTAEGIDGIMKEVEAACDGALKSEIDGLVKTQFLKNRLESDDNGKLVAVTRRFRHYLRLVNAPHRVAYTRLMLSDHRLAVEGLRHGNRVWRFVERELRLCRFGCAAVEDECHALLVCGGHPSLTGLRAHFLRDAYALRPDLRQQVQTMAAGDFLMIIVHCRDVTKRLAKFVYDIFAVFEQTEMLVPASHYIHGGVQ
ncbi:hypothetical protein C8R43DRAFT_174350 [Mycena crocata]|nr:hypothetical protein C8R43DRAFT_174350 [Mycena crocata]